MRRGDGCGLSGFRPCLPVAGLESPGYPVLCYENIDGGHAASANLNETAMRVALEHSCLSRRLMDQAPRPAGIASFDTPLRGYSG